MEFAPQTFLGITMSNHVRHQLGCCYLEEMDFEHLIANRQNWQWRVAYKHFFDNRVSMWGYLRYCFISVSMWSRFSYIRICDTAGPRSILKNFHIQEMHCLPSLLFGDSYRVRNLLTLVIQDVFWTHSTIHPPLPSFPLNNLFKCRTFPTW